jgi:hypothetical protein
VIFADLLRFSLHALSANRFRTFLTALGLVIGNASVILVVTISLTSEELILDQIRAIGSNMVYAQYEAGTNTSAPVSADFIKFSDVEAVRRQFAERIVAATGVMVNYDRIRIEGKDQDIAVIGSDDQYIKVRNLVLLAGRFMDAGEVLYRQKVAMITEKLAKRMFGSQINAVGQTIKIRDLQFTVIGTFKEKTESFGLSELVAETVLIPITVMRYYVPTERIDPMYVQAASPEEVEPLTRDIQTLLESRHRAGARYRVENLGSILGAAKNISLILHHLRHRHHEHHAGYRDGANPGNRHPHVDRRQPPRRHAAVSHGGRDHQRERRFDWDSDRNLGSHYRAVFRGRNRHPGSASVGDRGVCGFGGSGPGLRDATREQGFASESDGSLALRVTA